MTDLTALFTRLREATVPSRELDKAVMTTLAPDIIPCPTWFYPRPTSSLDCAIALVERVLPGWAWHCEKDANGLFWATVRLHQRDLFFEATHETCVCLALLTAAVTALIEREST